MNTILRFCWPIGNLQALLALKCKYRHITYLQEFRGEDAVSLLHKMWRFIKKRLDRSSGASVFSRSTANSVADLRERFYLEKVLDEFNTMNLSSMHGGRQFPLAAAFPRFVHFVPSLAHSEADFHKLRAGLLIKVTPGRL